MKRSAFSQGLRWETHRDGVGRLRDGAVVYTRDVGTELLDGDVDDLA